MGFMCNLSINANNSEFAHAIANSIGGFTSLEDFMLKSVLSVVLAISMFFFAGCYEVVSLSKEDYKTVNKYDQVDVLTDTSGVVTKYRFSRGMCVVQKDTLIGTGTRMSQSEQEDGVTVLIPESQINLVEVKKLNYLRTFTLVGILVVGTVGLILSIGTPGVGGSTGSGGSPSPR